MVLIGTLAGGGTGAYRGRSPAARKLAAARGQN